MCIELLKVPYHPIPAKEYSGYVRNDTINIYLFLLL